MYSYEVTITFLLSLHKLFTIDNIHRNVFLFSFVLSIDFSVFYCIINRSTKNLKGAPMFQQLSDTELMIMEYLWSQNTPKTFSEIKAFFEATTNKNWKKQTLSTFLLRLVKKEALYANHQEAKVTYYPALSSEEYYQQYTSQIIQTSFHGSLTSFISAFTGNKKLSASDKEELMDFLKGL